MTDVNEAFAAERRELIGRVEAYNAAIPERVAEAEQAAAELRKSTEDRIARGELLSLGGGRYRVMTGWDAGETWTTREVTGIPQPMLLPESNLDTTTGRAALYTRVPEWHGLGNVVPEGVTDLDEVLRLGGIDFEVIQVPTLYRRPSRKLEDGTRAPAATVEVPDSFVNVRSDTGAPLGVVGKVYSPIQNWVAGAWLQDLVRNHGVVFESAGATYEGRHVFIGLRLPDDVELDLGDGVTDIIRPYLYWLNPHDGNGSATMTISPWRVACGNTERFNLRDAITRYKVRHTTNATSDANLAEARRALGLTVKHFDAFKAEEEALARTELEIREFEALAAEVYPKPDADATDRSKRAWDERQGTLLGMYQAESGKLGRTAYAAERTFTDYFDHVAPRKVTGDRLAAARATAIIEGSDDKAKSAVHEKLLLRVR
jgi:phage/plasmid-like protein (TIGR03299 family)